MQFDLIDLNLFRHVVDAGSITRVMLPASTTWRKRLRSMRSNCIEVFVQERGTTWQGGPASPEDQVRTAGS